MFNPFKKKKAPEQVQTKKPEFVSSAKRERKKEPKKPWGKQERALVGGALLITILLSILMFFWQENMWSSIKNAFFQAVTSPAVITIEKEP